MKEKYLVSSTNFIIFPSLLLAHSIRLTIKLNVCEGEKAIDFERRSIPTEMMEWMISRSHGVFKLNKFFNISCYSSQQTLRFFFLSVFMHVPPTVRTSFLLFHHIFHLLTNTHTLQKLTWHDHMV